MEDKFIVKNNSGTIFQLPKYKITFTIGGSVDLCQRLNKTVQELKRDIDIVRELSYKNLILVEEFDSNVNDGIGDKLDRLLEIAKQTPVPQVLPTQEPMVPVSEIAKILEDKLGEMLKSYMVSGSSQSAKDEKEKVDEDDKMREDAMMMMLKSRKDAGEKNIQNLGKSKSIDNADDFSDLIDL